MSDYESLVEGYEGLGSPGDDPGPLTPEEEQTLVSHGMIIGDQKTADALDEILGVDEPPPFEDGDGFDNIDTSFMASEHAGEIRHLRSDQLPVAGHHYVICDGVPRPVVRDGYKATEDEYVRSNLVDGMEAARAVRADRTLRMRYRRYLCGESTTL